jgi:hypothetical protein
VQLQSSDDEVLASTAAAWCLLPAHCLLLSMQLEDEEHADTDLHEEDEEAPEEPGAAV